MDNKFGYPKEFQTHHNFIYELVRTTNCRKYLELGIFEGNCISKIASIVDKAVGVDINNSHNKNNFTFVQNTTDIFFSNNTELFDIIFIDADHHYEAVLTDFRNALKVLNKHGIIILHDTDPMYPYLLSQSYCGDSFKMLSYLKENHPELYVINLPISEAGLTLISRIGDQRHLQF